MNVNRLCGSGAQTVVSAIQTLILGDTEFALAGGAESMSRSPCWARSTALLAPGIRAWPTNTRLRVNTWMTLP